jgi:hypothetical protein
VQQKGEDRAQRRTAKVLEKATKLKSSFVGGKGETLLSFLSSFMVPIYDSSPAMAL